MLRTLIAGGTGFIGQRMAIKCQNMGHQVTVIGARKRRHSIFDEAGITSKYGNLSKTHFSDIVGCNEFEYVINLSGYIDHRTIAEGGWEIYETHTKSAYNLITGIDANTLKTFIQVGTSDEYGAAHSPQNEASREEPISLYSLAKLSNTHLIQIMARNSKFPGIVVRPFLVYGPGQAQNRLIPFVVHECLQDHSFDTTPGEQLRDFLYVDDFCDGVISLLDKPDLYGRIFNIASGKAVTIKKIIEKVITETGGGKANFGSKPYRTGESMALYADISAITAATGWTPKTSLIDGLRQTISDMKNST